MASINQTLFTAKEALLANLTAINLTGANIANVNTPGYTRLRPIFESAGTTNVNSTLDQAGVKIAGVQRIYDKYLEAQIVEAQSDLSNYTMQKDMLSYIEAILNESASTGINDALSQFWNTWSSLSINPSSDTARDSVISTAQNLSAVFEQRSLELTTIQEDTNASILDNINTLNSYLKDMVSLNNAIVETESAGGNTSSLRDSRGQLLNKISDIINIDYLEKENGSLYIYLPSTGNILVEEGNAVLLQAEENSNNNNLYDITFQNDLSHIINNNITGGKLAGLLAIRDDFLPSYLDALNQTATSLVNKVNDQHAQGYDLNGDPGADFFTSITKAKDMAVSEWIVTDSSRIAASATINGNGDNATFVSAIKNDGMYASMGSLSISDPTAYATGTLNNIGQAYKDTQTANPISLTRGATSADWTITDKGGYTSARILYANETSVTVDLNGNGTEAITFSLSGSWSNGDVLSFGLEIKEGATTIDSYYNSFISKVGQDVVNAAQYLETSNTISNQFALQRETLSGVSLDEEMMNLIKYQMAYNAAGRMTKAVSEIMDILMNLGQ